MLNQITVTRSGLRILIGIVKKSRYWSQLDEIKGNLKSGKGKYYYQIKNSLMQKKLLKLMRICIWRACNRRNLKKKANSKQL